ncbi:MAG: hypothetical protein V3V98_00160, partial [Thermoplasmata archaeon]
LHPFAIENHIRKSVRVFCDTWMEIYEKEKDIVRIGVHHTPRELKAEDLAQICYEASRKAMGMGLRDKEIVR